MRKVVNLGVPSIVGAFAVAGLLTGAPALASTVVAPINLDPGSTVSPLPNGFSSGDGIPETKLFDKSENFSFSDGLAGTLRERVIDYSDMPSVLHPGLYFDYEFQLASGNATAFTISGYSTFGTSVKVCGISGCGGSGANGLAPTSASRSSDGDEITFDFGNTLTAGQHSANLQIFSSASSFEDPLAFFTDSSGNSFSIDAVAPLPSAVPLPGAFLLFASALAGAAGFGMRKRNASHRTA
jgi:hypothetical protein